jgi:hypothetical protein
MARVWRCKIGKLRAFLFDFEVMMCGVRRSVRENVMEWCVQPFCEWLLTMIADTLGMER